MDVYLFRENVRNRINESVGFFILDPGYIIVHTDELRRRLPSGAGCLSERYNLFSSAEDPSYWCVWKMDEDYSAVGSEGWIPSLVRIKAEYEEADVSSLVMAVFRVNQEYLYTSLRALVEGFESSQT
jgi:hypothetical protein